MIRSMISSSNMDEEVEGDRRFTTSEWVKIVRSELP